MRRPNRSHAPGKTPAVAVKHGEGPEVSRATVDTHLEHFVEGIQIGAAMRVHDALGIAGRAAGVVNADWIILVLDRFVEQDVQTTGEKGLLVRPFQACPIIAIHDIDDRFQLRQLLPNWPNQYGEFGVYA